MLEQPMYDENSVILKPTYLFKPFLKKNLIVKIMGHLN